MKIVVDSSALTEQEEDLVQGALEPTQLATLGVECDDVGPTENLVDDSG